MREEFEKIPYVKELIEDMRFYEELNRYDGRFLRFVEYVNGMWWMYQELNKSIK